MLVTHSWCEAFSRFDLLPEPSVSCQLQSISHRYSRVLVDLMNGGWTSSTLPVGCWPDTVLSLAAGPEYLVCWDIISCQWLAWVILGDIILEEGPCSCRECCHDLGHDSGLVITSYCSYWWMLSDIWALLTLRAEHQSAQMSKIVNDGLTRSATGCFIAVSIWQQWVSNG